MFPTTFRHFRRVPHFAFIIVLCGTIIAAGQLFSNTTGSGAGAAENPPRHADKGGAG